MIAATLASLIATAAALAMIRGGAFRGRGPTDARIGLPTGLGTILIAHGTFVIPVACPPVACPPVAACPSGIEGQHEAAARSLCAMRRQAFRPGLPPLPGPGIVSGFGPAFIISLDDFIITKVVEGAGMERLPTAICGSVRLGLKPNIMPISTRMPATPVAFVTPGHAVNRIGRKIRQPTGKAMNRALLPCTVIASPALAEGEPKLYNGFECVPQELPGKFGSETGIDVTKDTCDGTQSLLAASKAGRPGRCALAVPGGRMVRIMADGGLPDSFASADLPGFAGIDPRWPDVPFGPGRRHAIPRRGGATASGVNRDACGGGIWTPGIILNPPDDPKGRIILPDSHGEVLAPGSIGLGSPRCTSDRVQPKAPSDMPVAGRTHRASFGADIAMVVPVSGDAAAGMTCGGFSARDRAGGANVEHAFRREGRVDRMDDAVLPKDPPGREDALGFMNLRLRPGNAAAVTISAAHAPGIPGAGPLRAPEITGSPESDAPEGQKGFVTEAGDEETPRLHDASRTVSGSDRLCRSPRSGAAALQGKDDPCQRIPARRATTSCSSRCASGPRSRRTASGRCRTAMVAATATPRPWPRCGGPRPRAAGA